MIDKPAPLEAARDVGDYVRAVEQTREKVQALHESVRDRMPMWVVLGPDTTDLSGAFLARLWCLRPTMTATGEVLRAASLAELRDLLPPGLTMLPRSPGDDPIIIETWL